MTTKPLHAARRSGLLLASIVAAATGIGHVPVVEAQWAYTRPATNCRHSNLGGGGWRAKTPLNGASQVGDVLFERVVAAVVDYDYGFIQAGKRYELVAGADWMTGTGVDANGVAQTNVQGIGLQLWVRGQDGQERLLHLNPSMVALDKDPVSWPVDSPDQKGSLTMTNYIQRLVLTAPPQTLPEGEFEVTGVHEGVGLKLTHVSYEQDRVAYGGHMSATYVPEGGGCNSQLEYFGSEILKMGGGGTVPIPNTCEVLAQADVPVNLGNFAPSDFPNPGDTSPERSFAVAMSRCSANAKPIVTFDDNNGATAGAGILNLRNDPGVARGFGIVIHRAEQGDRVLLGQGYAAPVVGDEARLELKASYIRTAIDASDMHPGAANGNAQFTFTFP